jgi:chromosome segregation ATPase
VERLTKSLTKIEAANTTLSEQNRVLREQALKEQRDRHQSSKHRTLGLQELQEKAQALAEVLAKKEGELALTQQRMLSLQEETTETKSALSVCQSEQHEYRQENQQLKKNIEATRHSLTESTSKHSALEAKVLLLQTRFQEMEAKEQKTRAQSADNEDAWRKNEEELRAMLLLFGGGQEVHNLRDLVSQLRFQAQSVTGEQQKWINTRKALDTKVKELETQLQQQHCFHESQIKQLQDKSKQSIKGEKEQTQREATLIQLRKTCHKHELNVLSLERETEVLKKAVSDEKTKAREQAQADQGRMEELQTQHEQMRASQVQVVGQHETTLLAAQHEVQSAHQTCEKLRVEVQELAASLAREQSNAARAMGENTTLKADKKAAMDEMTARLQAALVGHEQDKEQEQRLQQLKERVSEAETVITELSVELEASKVRYGTIT